MNTKIGQLVRLKIPGLNGMRLVAGTVVRHPDEWTTEVRTQQDGYHIIANTQVLPAHDGPERGI